MKKDWEPTFRVDPTIPVFETSIDLGDFDKGKVSVEQITNIVRPEVVFKSEEGLSVKVLYSHDSGTTDALDQTYLL